MLKLDERGLWSFAHQLIQSTTINSYYTGQPRNPKRQTTHKLSQSGMPFLNPSRFSSFSQQLLDSELLLWVLREDRAGREKGNSSRPPGFRSRKEI
jgi:hypothetical protein